MALGLTQPLTEMSTRNISWGVKEAGAYGWQPYHLHVPTVLKSGSLSLLEPWGPVQACNGIALPFTTQHWWYQSSNIWAGWNVKYFHVAGGRNSRYSDLLRAGRPGVQASMEGEIFPTRPDWLRGPLSLLYNGSRVPRGVNHPPHLAPRFKKE